jgi:chemosensory pili system protein ChpA (sensor histidine kinase/response regulator)
LAGVLKVLDQPGAADVLAGLRPFLLGLAHGAREAPDEAERDALADVITGVEYYLEAAIEDRSNRQDILAYATQALHRLVATATEGAAGRSTEPPSAEAAAATAQPAPEDAEASAEAQAVAAGGPEGQEVAAVPAAAPREAGEAHPETLPEPAPGPDLAGGQEAPALLPDIDPEILEVFLEEAREELSVIRDEYPRWREHRDDEKTLQTFRRSFHTLKGSGRLVGAAAIGEFAWSVENLLNRVIEGTVAADDTLVGLLDEVVELLPALVEAQAGGEAPAQSRVDGLSERAFALAAGKAAETAVPAAAPVAEAPSQAPEVVEPAPGVDAPLPAPAPLALEEGLFDVFHTEAATHLGALSRVLEQWREGVAAPPFDRELERAMHTLHGSAHMADVMPVAELAGELEHYVAAQARLGAQVDETAGDLLARAAACLEALVGAINRPGAALPEWQALCDEVRAQREVAHRRLLRGAGEAEITVAGEPVADEAVAMDTPAGEAVESVRVEPETVEPEQPLPQVPESVAAEPEFDAELLEIFLEEARELVDRMEAEFQAWFDAPTDLAPVADLQRTLHTLKGGARLAGISELGNLSHAMETMFESIVHRLLEVSPELQSETRRGVDALADAVEHLQAGGRLPPLGDAIERIDSAARGVFLEPDAMSIDRAVEAPGEPVGIDLEPESGADSTLAAAEASDLEIPEEPESEDSMVFAESELVEDSVLVDAPSQDLGFFDSADAGEVIPFPEGGTGSGTQPEAGQQAAPRQAEAGRAEGRRASDRVRVRADLLDQLVNNAGEVSIYRARLAQQNTTLGFDLEELDRTVHRLREQLRKLELETEAQILSHYETEQQDVDFDPLELDRYSTIQELSRALSETVSDLGSIGHTLQELNRDTDTLLLQQARVSNELQDGLLRTRMVPFGSRTAHLQRVVRQTGETLGKPAELHVSGAHGEIDRNILERVVAPLEHLLRNAVAHGIEDAEQRARAGKPAVGRVDLAVSREGTDVVIAVSDDGAGLDRAAIRQKAVERGLLDPAIEVSDADLDAMILAPGFSTSKEVTQVAGRGVGTDVVLNEVKQLGGALQVASQPGEGATFTIRLPFTLSISEGLLVQQGDDVYAVPHGTVDGVIRVSREELEACYTGQQNGLDYADTPYRVRYLGSMLGTAKPSLAEGVKWFPVLLVRAGDHRVAIQVDGLLGNRQVVVKSVGSQLASIRWFTGATILADGSVALILDVDSLVRIDAARQVAPAQGYVAPAASKAVTVMVVDDSITVRKVTSRLLERHNMQVVTAKDGVDAVAKLQEVNPDVMLLDIEMPRMDGFELARHMQNSPDLAHVPIVMITSRTGDKHRDRALELGVSRYLGKPYQEAELLDNIYSVLAERSG